MLKRNLTAIAIMSLALILTCSTFAQQKGGKAKGKKPTTTAARHSPATPAVVKTKKPSTFSGSTYDGNSMRQANPGGSAANPNPAVIKTKKPGSFTGSLVDGDSMRQTNPAGTGPNSTPPTLNTKKPGKFMGGAEDGQGIRQANPNGSGANNQADVSTPPINTPPATVKAKTLGHKRRTRKP